MTAPRTLPQAAKAAPSRLSSPAVGPRLWDPVVRITHWGIALVVVSNALVTAGGSVAHVTLGWVAMALLGLRLVWGVLGPAEARFSAFPPNPSAAVRHLANLWSGKAHDHRSHNPAGALMVYAFWSALAIIILTGLVMTGGETPMRIAADKAAVASGDWSALIEQSANDSPATDSRADANSALRKTAEEVHALAANLLLVLAALHLAGVFVESRALRRNLVAAMTFGERRR